MWILNRAGRIPFVISGQGHEGAQVGIAWRSGGAATGSLVLPPIASCLTFGMSARDLMLAQYAKSVDPSSGGRQMPGHYGHPAHHLVSVSSPVATQILHAVGIALAARIRGVDQVAVAIMGEGSSNQGDVHEALNFAAIHRLPFVFIVENTGYAISVPSEKGSASGRRGPGLRLRIPGVVVDGTDVLACYAASREAVERARSGGGPTLIEAKVTRLTAHSSDDQQTKYRSEDDLAAGKAHDPLPIFRAACATRACSPTTSRPPSRPRSGRSWRTPPVRGGRPIDPHALDWVPRSTGRRDAAAVARPRRRGHA
jgi:2-oxoisovalerate dehydrogenase E1 component alpha subunit